MMTSMKTTILLLLGIVPASLAASCSTGDSTTYTFGTYEYNGGITTRDCAWITTNPSKTADRIATWCGETYNGLLVSGECPDACGLCSSAPSLSPTPYPTATPTSSPTISAKPTSSPTRPPSPAPSPFPTARPSNTPSQHPSDVPSVVPSDVPSNVPSLAPSDVPSLAPSLAPSDDPSEVPSDIPSVVPSLYPSLEPSAVPSDGPSLEPSEYPSLEPSAVPSESPTGTPTLSIKPSPSPSAAPVGSTSSPTAATAVTASPTAECVDSPLRLKFRVNGNMLTRSCEWAARKDTNNRCSLIGDAACPVTCGACSVCADPDPLLIKFRFDYNGRSIARNCDFVGRIPAKVNGRCAATGNICRQTCGKC